MRNCKKFYFVNMRVVLVVPYFWSRILIIPQVDHGQFPCGPSDDI